MIHGVPARRSPGQFEGEARTVHMNFRIISQVYRFFSV